MVVRNANQHTTATGNHMPYGITQCDLPPDTVCIISEIVFLAKHLTGTSKFEPIYSKVLLTTQ